MLFSNKEQGGYIIVFVVLYIPLIKDLSVSYHLGLTV
jgi:hypothetical protein